METNLNETLPKVVWDSKYYSFIKFEKVCGEKINEFYTMAKNFLPFKDEFYHSYESGITTYFLRDILGKINIPKEEICHISVSKTDYDICTLNCHLENSQENIEINILKDKNNFKFRHFFQNHQKERKIVIVFLFLLTVNIYLHQ